MAMAMAWHGMAGEHEVGERCRGVGWQVQRVHVQGVHGEVVAVWHIAPAAARTRPSAVPMPCAKPVAVAGMLITTQCKNPAPPVGASRSCTVSAKLLVPGGGFAKSGPATDSARCYQNRTAGGVLACRHPGHAGWVPMNACLNRADAAFPIADIAIN